MKKYHTVLGLLKAKYVTCRYMYVTYDLNTYDYIKIVEMSISSSTNYNKLFIILEISFEYFQPFWAPYLKDQPFRLDIRRKDL